MVTVVNGPQNPGLEEIKSGIHGLINHHVQKKAKQQSYENQFKVAKALGLPNPEGLAHADASQFEQIIKRQQSSGAQHLNPAFNDYLNGGQEQQGDEMQQLMNGPQQQQQMQPQEQQEGQPQQTQQYSPQDQKKIQKAIEALDMPEAEKILGPEGVEHMRKVLGGQLQQPGQQLGGKPNNEQQLYERAVAGANSHQLSVLKEIKSSREGGHTLNVKLSPIDEKYAERVESRAEVADEIEPILNDIGSILKKGPYDSKKNPEGYNTGLIESYSPISLLKNSTTQDLNNLMNALITKQSTLESQGKGSDLLRNMIKDGKLSLGQTPKSLQNTYERLVKANKEDQDKAKTLEGIISQNEGKSVSNLRDKVKKQLNAPLLIDDAGQKWKMVNGKPVRA